MCSRQFLSSLVAVATIFAVACGSDTAVSAMEIPATPTPLLAAPPLSIDHSGTPVPAYVPLTTNQTLLSVPGEDRPFPRELADDSSVLSGDNALDHWLRYLIGTRTRSDNRASVMDLCADRTGRMTGGAFAAGIRGFQEFGWLLERDAARGSKDIVLRALFFNKEINAGHEVRLLFTVDDGRSAAYNEQSAEVEPITAASGADCD